jgi:hypothetical protein
VVFAIVSALFGALIAALRPRASLVVEVLVLRQQLAVLKRARPRPHLRPLDRGRGLDVFLASTGSEPTVSHPFRECFARSCAIR